MEKKIFFTLYKIKILTKKKMHFKIYYNIRTKRARHMRFGPAYGED